MGFLTKICSFCNTSIFAFGGYALADGCYCKQCKAKLSPFFIHNKTLTINELRDQLEKRKSNEQAFATFILTKSIGNQPQLLIDEVNGQFYILLTSQKSDSSTPDVINFAQIVDCSIDITEEKTEVKYKDFNDNLKSFSPPYYAYSFDFFLNISVSIPYIQTIRIKLNTNPIDNDQPHIIEKTGGIGQMFKDALGSARSFNGMTSNITEVQASSAYQKYTKISNDMKEALLEGKKSLHLQKATSRCPWCDCIVTSNSAGTCEHCGGAL